MKTTGWRLWVDVSAAVGQPGVLVFPALKYLLSCRFKNTHTVSFKVFAAVSTASGPEHWPVSRNRAALTSDMHMQKYTHT